MARDLFHDTVKVALQKDGWCITHDPYQLPYSGDTNVFIDLAAEEAIAAEKEGRKIAVEIKSFMSGSTISEFHTALGQFLNYRVAIENSEEPTRILYLAVPVDTYRLFLRFEPAKTMDRISKYQQSICNFLEDFAQFDATVQLVFDQKRNRYLAMRNEWRNYDRIYGCAIQLDLIDGQVWIQQNSTEIYVDRELIKLGIAPQDIIFGFRAPNIRKRLTEALADSY